MKPFCSCPVAHRGIHDNIKVPENSMSAFSNAIDANCGIELDVQFTKDRQLVVFHDDDLSRLCGDKRLLIDVTYNELLNMRLLGTDEKIPKLTEVLELIDGRVPLLIEMKNALDAVWELPAKLYETMKNYDGLYAIESFNPMFVRKYKKLDKSTPRGILSFKFGKVGGKGRKIIALTLENLMWNFLAKPDFVAYKMSDYKKIPFRLNRILGATTFAWDVPKELKDAEKEARKYFDAFICDISSLGEVQSFTYEINKPFQQS